MFVLGSGLSRAAHPSMPTVRDLEEHLLERLTEAGRTDLLADGGRLVTRDVEALFGFLAARQPFLREPENLENRARFLRLSEWLAEHLWRCQERALGSPMPGWLGDLVRYMHEQRSTVITLNYDTLIESTVLTLDLLPKHRKALGALYAVRIAVAEARYAGVIRGEVAETLRLVKLHGSLNWFYSGAEGFFGETIFDARGHVTWGRRDPEAYRNLKAKVPGLVPLVIPPTPAKSTYFENETVRELWWVARAALESADEVWLVGYSLPTGDQQMAALLASTCAGKTIVPVNTDERVADRIREAVARAEVRADFLGGDDAVKRATGSLTKEF